MLIQLTVEEYPKIATFFGPSYPNLAFIHAVIEGKIPGRVWAWSSGQGAAACLVTTGSPFCFASGALDSGTLEEMLRLLKARPPVKLIYPATPGASAVALDHGFADAGRVQFGHAHPADADRMTVEIPEPYELARIDDALFEQINWKDMVLGIFGSPANYLKSGYGFVLLHQGRAAAEAHGVVGGDLVEIGIFTHQDHRRRGLARAVCAQASKHGARRGLRTILTCDEDKAATIAISHSMGLGRDFSYRALNLAR